MSVENQVIVRSYLEQVWNKGQIDRFDEFMAKDLAPHSAAGVTDAESAKQSVVRFRDAFLDMQITLDDEITAEDKVVTRWTISGTQQGDLPGIPATGKHAVWSGISIFRVAGGKFA